MIRRHQPWHQILKSIRILWRKILFFAGVFAAVILACYFLGYNPFPKTAWFPPGVKAPSGQVSKIAAEPTAAPPQAAMPSIAAIAPPAVGQPQTSPITAEASVEAEASLKDNLNMSDAANLYRLEIIILEDGRVKIADETIKESVQPKENYDEFRYIVLDKQPEAADFYDGAEAILHLPKAVSNTNAAEIRTIGVHGVETTSAFFKDPQTVIFQAKGVMPTATLTILARLPKGILDLSVTQKAQAEVLSWSAILWLIVGALLPMGGLIIFIRLLLVQRFENRVAPQKTMIDRPPSNLPPASVGLLFYGRLRPRDIVATFLSLASRGLIEIHENQGQMVIFKRRIQDVRLWQTLHPFEQLILKETVGSEHIRTQDEFQQAISRELFSKNITQAYEVLYKAATAAGFFEKNPLEVHFRVKGIGLIFFFAGLLGLILGNFIGPAYGLLFWAGVVLLGVLIVNLASRLSSRTEGGRQEIAQWLKFRNYLALRKPIDYQSFAQGAFEKYLPYAVAMNCEVAWAARFSADPFELPGWFSSVGQVSGIEEFAAAIFPLTDFLGKKLAFVREPTVD